MKRQLLLGIIPVLMALSACNGATSHAFESDNFEETTSACTEIFGEANYAGELKAKRNSVEGDLLKPVIGVQYKDQKDGRYAIRFIAAIASLYVNAYWTRGVTQLDNTPIKPLESGFESTTAYTSLKAGNETITPAAFAEDARYNFFITYSMYNIPAAQLNSYMIAYATITDDVEPKVLDDSTSDAYVSQIGEGGGHFTIEHNQTYFMGGRLGAKDNKAVASDIVTYGDNNHASFSFDFSLGDSFYVFRHNPSEATNYKFEIFGFPKIQGSTIFTNDSGKIKASSAASKTLYVSNDDHKIHVANAYDISLSVDIAGKEEVESVNVAGNFNGWNTYNSMNQVSETKYSLTIQNLPEGYYAYFKFVINNSWERDESHDRLVMVTGPKTLEYVFDDHTTPTKNITINASTILTDGAQVGVWAWEQEGGNAFDSAFYYSSAAPVDGVVTIAVPEQCNSYIIFRIASGVDLSTISDYPSHGDSGYWNRSYNLEFKSVVSFTTTDYVPDTEYFNVSC